MAFVIDPIRTKRSRLKSIKLNDCVFYFLMLVFDDAFTSYARTLRSAIYLNRIQISANLYGLQATFVACLNNRLFMQPHTEKNYVVFIS